MGRGTVISTWGRAVELGSSRARPFVMRRSGSSGEPSCVRARLRLAESLLAQGYSQEVLAAAQEHNASAAAVSARLMAAALLEANGDAKAAFEARKLAAAEAPSRSGVKALAETRYAVALEASGDL